jgi:uncharacterized protein (TIGR02611 family)
MAAETLTDRRCGVCDTARLEPEDQGRLLGTARRWLDPARSHVHRWPAGRHAWRIAIAIVGLAVVVAGTVMLVLPGPGWLVIFLGFTIWATEFPWANAVALFVRRQISRCTALIRRQPRWLLVAGAGLCLAAVGLLALLVLF